MEKLCGYCRNPGHTAPVCPTRLGQIADLKAHVARERKARIDLAVGNGYGIGAIVEHRDYWGTPRTCVIRSHHFLAAGQYFETYEIKYRKSVRHVFEVIGTRPWGNNVTSSDYCRFRTATRVAVQVSPLDNMGEMMGGNIYVDLLPNKPVGRPALFGYEEGQAKQYHMKLLAPSDETDATVELIVAPVVISARLSLRKGVRTIDPDQP